MHFPLLLAAVVGGEIVDLVGETGPVAKVVLLSLLIFSVISWAIILSKWSLVRRARVQSGRFVRAFRKAQRLPDVSAVAEQFKPSPLVAVFENGFAEHKRQGGSIAMQRAMQIACSEEVTRLERNMPWLAITGAVTPFVGLFGTVWGIMDSFHGLGTAGAATLRAVAPGISEALITTAAGLAAAIPAVIGYNLLGSSNGRTQSSISDINVTPLVDVVLVLLIIFMVTAPVLQSGIEVSVPKTRTVKEISEERTVITINKDQRVFLGNDAININQIAARLKQKIRDPRNQSIFIRADENVPFGAFATVMDAVKASGITNVSIVTQPLDSHASQR